MNSKLQGEPTPVLIIAGYGDKTGYIKLLTHNWPEKLNLTPQIYAFGTDQPAEAYPKLWSQFEEKLRSVGKCAIIGISFGGIVGARAIKEYPELVQKLVCVATPFAGAITSEKKHNKVYPLLNRSISYVDESVLTAENTLTFRSRFSDSIAPPDTMQLNGVRNQTVNVPGHILSILATLSCRAKHIADFIHEVPAK